MFAGRDEDAASADDAHPLLHLVVRVEVVLHGLAPPPLPEHLGLDLRLPALDNSLTRDHLQYTQPASQHPSRCITSSNIDGLPKR